MPTKIEYVDEAINPIRTKGGGWHCVKCSPGCLNCYAEKINKRFGDGCDYYENPDQKIELVLNEKALEKPLHWKKPKKIFVQDMSDLFHEDVPVELIFNVFLTMIKANQHIYLILTKRPQKMKESIDEFIFTCTEVADDLAEKQKIAKYQEIPTWFRYGDIARNNMFNKLFSHVWFGVTVENQEMADKRIPILLEIPAAVRFVSVEPMLGPVDFSKWLMPKKDCQAYEGNPTPQQKEQGVINCVRPENVTGNCEAFGCVYGEHNAFDWVICGCESGPKRRYTDYSWVKYLRDQCIETKTPFFLKQFVINNIVEKMPSFYGRIWDQMPEE